MYYTAGGFHALSVMKRLPFNACDYRCERCLETEHCAVFQQVRDRAAEISDGDASAVLDDLRESFRETEIMIKEKARELGIDLDEIAGGSTPEEIRDERERSKKDPLFLHCDRFREDAGLFLKAVDASVVEADRQYVDDIAWHHTVIPAKIFRALGWRTDDEDTIAMDARNSAAVAIKSLSICILAFDHLASRHPSAAADCSRLSIGAARIKQEIRNRFFPS